MAITQTFSQATINGTDVSNPTSLQFGPDGRLYVSQQNGVIKSYTVTESGGSWTASGEQVIDLVNQIPNHNDDGSLSGQNNRQVTGIAVEGTAENPILYVTSSDPRIGAGSGGNDSGLDTNSGVLSRLTWNGNSWDKVDLVIGLSRSEENHSTNGLDIRTESVEVSPGTFEDHEILYVASGGHDNKGAPSNNFAYTPEYYYSGAVLRIDLTQLEEIEQDLITNNGGLNGGTAYVDEYVYALPTLDDPTRANTNGITGVGALDGADVDGDGDIDADDASDSANAEAADTFGGNDGRNQAKFDPDGPVQVYSPGYRNAYDVVLTEAGNLYTFDNGPNNGWGGDPVSDDGVTEVTSDTQVATNQPNLADNTNDGDPDSLHFIEEGTYGGHPNPTRASGAAAGLWSGQGGGLSEDVQLTPAGDPANDAGTVWDDLPADWDSITGDNTNPIEGVYYGPDNSPGPMDESLFAINSSSNGLTEYTATGIGDGGPNTEYLAVASFNGNITLMEIQTDGTAAGSTVTDNVSIQVGGTPLDVTALGNGGIPGSNGVGAGAMFVAQIGANEIVVLAPGTPPGTDLDADNDGVLDKDDPLQFDPDNGTQTVLQGGQTLFWDFNPASPNPGPDGEYNIGFNGWMIDGEGEVNPDVLNDDPSVDLLTDLDNTIRGGAPGVIQVKQVGDGDAYLAGNSQNDAIQTGFTPAGNVQDFTIRVPIFNPYSSVGLDQNFGSVGFALGDGSQNNYLKVVAGVGGGVPRLQVFYEENDGQVVDITVNGSGDSDFDDAATNATGNALFDLFLKVDLSTPGAATAQAFYNYELAPGGGYELVEPKAIGGLIPLQGEVLNAVLGQKMIGSGGNELPSSAIVTLLSTSTGPESPFQANFADLEITSTEKEVPPTAEDDQASTGVGVVLNIPVAELLANDSDLNVGDTLSVTSVGNAVNGTVALNDNGSAGNASDDYVSFTPTAGFTGAASFDYTIDDGTGLTDTATVSIGVADRVTLYRVNAGGGEIIAIDGGLNWSADTGGANSAYLSNPGSNDTNGFGVTPGATVDTDSTPADIFLTERWDAAGGAEMAWAFEAEVPAFYEVRLFMGNGFDGTSQPGQRVFDVTIEGDLISDPDVTMNLDDIDLSEDFGDLVGGMVTNVVQVTDGTLNIEFLHGVENPLINGIEIARLGAIDVDPTVSIIGGDQSVGEGDGSVGITLTTDILVPAAESVDVTFEIIPGTATAAEDYSYASGAFNQETGVYTDTVTIVGSSSDATFFIDILQEIAGSEEEEPAEAFTVQITGVSSNAQIGTASATVTIIDDDATVAPLYRVNVGGGQLAAADGSALAWSADTGNFGDAGNNANLAALSTGASTFSTSSGSSVPVTSYDPGIAASAPEALFDTERYDPDTAPEMKWEFQALTPGEYTVNLFFAEIFNGITGNGQRVFDITVEGDVPASFDDIDPYAIAGAGGAFMRSATVNVTDGVLDIEAIHGAENPALKGIEIIGPSGPPPMLGEVVAAINAGGGALSQDGIDFAADDDAYWTGGTPFADGGGGNGEQPAFDGTVYETERYGGADAGTMSLEVDVAPGEYQIQLYLAEIYQSLPEERIFDVTVEGQLVLDDYDILAANGGDINQPVVLTLEGTFSPDAFGNPDALDIDFSASADNAKLSAIVVRDATPPAPTGGAATLTVNNGSNDIEASNYGDDSFAITNVGNKNISYIEIDVSGALFPDAVFDPFGVAGDQTSKILTLNGGSDGNSGLVVPTGGFGQGAIDIVYLGTGGASGFEKVRLEFTDFNPGESFSFGLDMDPNSIAGAQKSTLDSGGPLAGAGGDNQWDIGGIGGAELAGSLFTVGYSDGTTSEGQLQGQGSGQQMGAEALASQDSENLAVSITVNGLGEGAEGTYADGGPQILIQGPAGETARVLVAKGFIVPFTNEFADADPYRDQLDAQLQALEASGFPANNAVEMLYVDVPLDGSVQDISSMFDFTQVAGFDLSVPDQTNEFGVLDEAQLPLGIVASVIDVATDQSKGPVTSPIHLQYAENAAPTITPIDDIAINETETATFNVQAADLDGDAIALSAAVTRDSDGGVVDPSAYDFTDNGDGTGAFSWTTAEPDDGAYTVTVTADDGTSQTTEAVALIVNELADPQPGTVLFRVNAGGNVAAAIDGGPDWSSDTDATPSPYRVEGGPNVYSGSDGGAHPGLIDFSAFPDLATRVPEAVFNIERWDQAAAPEMSWAFPILAGTEVEVRLYFAELYGGVDMAGERVFDVSVEGTVPAAFDDIDQFGIAGAKGAIGLSSTVVVDADGELNLVFVHDVIENPAIKGIEILVAGEADADAPTAALTADNVAAAGDAYTFTVEFADATAVDVSTLDDFDVSVSNGVIAFDTTATLVSVDVPADGTPRTATYEITPPGGTWDVSDNGIYTITLNDGEVSDILGNAAPGEVLGTFEVATPETVASALIEVTPDTGLDASTFSGSSFQISNTSDAGVQIASVSIDLSTAILPDIVFDPTGAGGDATASPFTPNGGAAATGLVVPNDPSVDPFSQARNGGFDVITVDFTDFDPGEQFLFTTDVDPNSIQGVPGAGNAGAISGYELVGSTVTVTYSDGRVVTGSLFEDGSLGGSQAVVASGAGVTAPTIELVGSGADESSLPGIQTTASGGDNQVVRVSGTAGENFALLQMDTRLYIASGEPPFDVAADELPFYANEAMAGKAVYTGEIGPDGYTDVPVTLLETDSGGATPDGGLNHFVAVTSSSPYAVDQATGQTSNTLVVKKGAPLVYDAPGVMEFDGLIGSVLELPHLAAYEVAHGTVAFSFNAADTSGAQGLFAKDASFFGGGGHTTIYLNGSTLIARFQDDSTSAELSFGGIVAGQEYEIAATFGPDGVELWVDGNLVDSDALAVSWAGNEEFVQWGGRGWGSNPGAPGFDAPFEGTISDKQIYGEVLTEYQIAALAASSSGSNTPPSAVDDVADTDEDVAAVIPVTDLLANDNDDDGDDVAFAGVASDPTNGTVFYDDAAGTLTYTPDPDFNGTDTFEIEVTDGVSTSTSTITVTVDPVNDDPVAVDDADTTTVGAPVVIDVTANDTDVDGNTLTITGATDGTRGTVVSNGDGTVTYTPNPGEIGNDSFTYTIEDGAGGDPSQATVTVSILAAPNTPPVAFADDVEVAEDGSVTFQPGANDVDDDDGDTVAASAIVTAPSNGEATVNADDTVTYTPDPDFSGADSFEVQVTDGNGGFDTSVVNVTVTPENDQPDAVDDNATTGQGEAVIIDVISNDTDIDGDALSVVSVTDGTGGTVVNNGNGTVTYTPDALFEGDDSFTYTIDDGNGGSDTATVTINVTSFPDAIAEFPDATFDGSSSAVDQQPHDVIYEFPEGTVNFAFTAQDTSGAQGLFVKDASGFAGGGNHLAIYLNGSTLTARFQDGSSSATITVSGIAAGEEYDVAATFGPAGSELYIDGVSVGSSPLVMNWTQNVEYIQWGGRGWGSASGQPGFDAPFEGTITDRKIYDIALTADRVAELHADGPLNNPPVAVDDEITLEEDGSANFDPTSNDSDLDEETLVVNGIATDPANGSVQIENDGSVTYTPDADFFGSDSFELVIGDGNGGTDTSTVDVTVTPVDDDPVANDDEATVQAGKMVTIDVLANDSDADGDLLVIAGNTEPVNGSVVDNGDGTFTYTPDVGFDGPDSFVYTLSDGDGPPDTAIVTIGVTVEPTLPTPVFEQAGAKTYSGSSGDVDNYAPVPALNIPEGTIAFSFTDGNPGVRQGLVVKDASGYAGGGNHFAAYVESGDLKVRFQDGGDQDIFVFEDLVPNQEYEVAAVFSGTGVELWVDGELADESGLVMDWTTNVEYLQVGGLGWGSSSGGSSYSNPFSGQIADVEIYDRALSQGEIEILAQESSLIDTVA